MNILADKAHYESHLEAYIVQKLQAQGWVVGQSKNYHTEYALYPEDLITWIQATQPEKREKLPAELEGLGRIESRKAELQGERDGALKQAMEVAKKLSDERGRVAVRLADRLCDELASLAMPGARLEVEIRPGAEADLDEGGLDRVRFLFSANPGEEVRPLVKVASGGELSRVLLALKTVLAEVDRVPVYVFDEVDSGVGGAVAEVIGDKLSSLAAGHQIFCITHLPQIAAHATGHFSVRKRQRGGRTVSQIARLDTLSERIEEVARMVGGREVTDEARSHACDLLERARRNRNPDAKDR